MTHFPHSFSLREKTKSFFLEHFLFEWFPPTSAVVLTIGVPASAGEYRMSVDLMLE